jgi:hypothetical protein
MAAVAMAAVAKAAVAKAAVAKAAARNSHDASRNGERGMRMVPEFGRLAIGGSPSKESPGCFR